MPITNNVAWDADLEAFKGRDTTSYVAVTAATATACAACRLALAPATQYFTFDAEICHRSCREPGLTCCPPGSLAVS
ncbi:hypothetical protein LFT45_19800 [Arthrobacter sp. FW305-BF8]|uniref:hypothetical protein n=1 Tax=Arthrobacter sp. FW305-BF8 TaxID=2879617 RepID=UPI001F2AAF90|nr:hypothetical protein [Arthrobacter sp. FW305-BF8]UKA53925.1 hypothetical protein LFT45_19800 [Arthrobacter sp. FW305-BF8]